MKIRLLALREVNPAPLPQSALPLEVNMEVVQYSLVLPLSATPKDGEVTIVDSNILPPKQYNFVQHANNKKKRSAG